MKRLRRVTNRHPHPSGDREAIRVWRWKCESAISRYLTRFARHGGLPLARAGIALLQNRLRILHGVTPANIRSLREWERFHDLCETEAGKVSHNLQFLCERPDLITHGEALDALQHRLARGFLAGQIMDSIDNAIDVGLHLPPADNDNIQEMDAMVIGDLVFWKQPALPDPPIRQSAWFTQD